jgi:hypothetical protein
VNFNYTEANAWQYSLYVPQDIGGLEDLLGGREAFAKRLDELFGAQIETTGRDQADITGLIGQYAHGNEPSHHMAYLYNYAGQPWKTQETVHRIMNGFYTGRPDGLCGNEDCGQMSAWYVFSALGFYPVTPGSGEYAIGTPLFPKATIYLENGNTFTIIANNLSDQNFYVQSITLNDIQHPASSIQHQDVMKGGELIFEMGPQPNYELRVTSHEPRAMSHELIQPVPYVLSGESTFFDSTTIALSSPDFSARIFYTTDIQHPASSIQHRYIRPFTIHETTTIRAFAQREGGEPGFTIESVFQKIPKNRKITLNTTYASQYSAGGYIALIDFKRGGQNFRTGSWQGYEGVDLDAVVDLGEVQEIRKISVGFLQDAGSWIFYPVEVFFYTSPDGNRFDLAGSTVPGLLQTNPAPGTTEQSINPDPPLKTRYIRVVAKNPGVCPSWHPGAGKPCWIFADEIVVEDW